MWNYIKVYGNFLAVYLKKWNWLRMPIIIKGFSAVWLLILFLVQCIFLHFNSHCDVFFRSVAAYMHDKCVPVTSDWFTSGSTTALCWCVWVPEAFSRLYWGCCNILYYWQEHTHRHINGCTAQLVELDANATSLIW